MLYDFEKGCSVVDPEALKRSDIYRKFEQVTHPKTITTTFKKLNSFISEQNPSAKSQLVWIRLAKMWGRSSTTPHKDICYLEDVVFNAVGGDKNFLMLAGTLLMICVAERQGETWLTSKTSETEKFDRETGKEIAYRSYWIDNNFKPIKKSGFSVKDLATKFNRK
jgi:hypothetical protein